MIEVELVWVAFARMGEHSFGPWQLLLDLHQYLNFWSIERGIVVEPSKGEPHYQGFLDDKLEKEFGLACTQKKFESAVEPRSASL